MGIACARPAAHLQQDAPHVAALRLLAAHFDAEVERVDGMRLVSIFLALLDEQRAILSRLDECAALPEGVGAVRPGSVVT